MEDSKNQIKGISLPPNDITFVVVAGGAGRRMGATIPKQYLELLGKPILTRTIEALGCAFDVTPKVVLVVPKGDVPYVQEHILGAYHISVTHIVEGGATRYESVWAGLQYVATNKVAIHDAVRPLVSRELVNRLVEGALSHQAVVPVISPTDSVRLLDDKEGNTMLPRHQLALVQTPQLFTTDLLKEAYRAFLECPNTHCTDDASIVSEIKGVVPFLVVGDEHNIKLTTPKDLVLASYFLSE